MVDAAGGSTSLVGPALGASGISLSWPRLFQLHARCPITGPGASGGFSHCQTPCIPHCKEPNAVLMLPPRCRRLASARGTKSLASQRLNKCALLFSFGGFCGFGFSWNLCQKCSSFFPKFFDWACLAGRVFWQEGGGTFCSETFHRMCPLISLA